jgi:hypothetical protein
MEEIQPTGRLAGELRSTKKVTVIPEKTYVSPAQTVVERTFYGPCLVCAKDIQYSFYWRWSTEEGTEEWLLKQFEPSRRKAHLSFLEGRRKDGFCQLRVLHGIVCVSCQEKYATARTAIQRVKAAKEELKRQAELEEAEVRLHERERWEYHTTWRDAEVGEFGTVPDGVARFTARVSRGRTHKILFRWRPVGGKCQGNSPRNVVGMWVDRQFITHYHGWNIEPFDGEPPQYQWGDYEEAEDFSVQDVFGVGFCRWFERAFQPELLRITPAATWEAKGSGWPTGINPLYEEVETPAVVHTRWIDGAVYARLLCDNELPKVLAFASEHLGMNIVRTTAV